MGSAETEETEQVGAGRRHCHFKTICSFLNAAASVLGLPAIWPGQEFGSSVFSSALDQGLWNFLR